MVKSAEPAKVWAIALHGGAGRLPQPMEATLKQRYEESLSASLKAGRDVLVAGGSALDAVQATVMVLEDNPLFNAGKGLCLPAPGSTSWTPRSWMAQHFNVAV